VANKNTYWKDVVEKSQKVVTFIDLCGHEKYLKTTIFGLVAMVPDYSMIIVGANMGVSKMTREHLGLSLFLKIPFMVILTKTDIAPQNVHEETLDTLKSLIKSPAVRRSPVLFDENTPMDEIDKWAAIMHGNSVTPIFNVSSVTGQGLPQLRRFIARVSNRTSINKAFQSKDAPPEFDIQENFKVPGVERVVSGTMRSGTVKVGTVLLLGPNKSRCTSPPNIDRIQGMQCEIHPYQPSAGERGLGWSVCLSWPQSCQIE
jgi:GTPase